MRKIKIDKLGIILGFVIFALCILFIVEKFINIKNENIERFKIRSNARIIRNEVQVINTNYENASLPLISKGEIIDIIIDIPIEKFRDPVLVFQSGNNKIKVYQGNYQIYAFGELLYKEKAPVTDTQLIIPLDIKKGSQIRIQITATKSAYMFEFPELVLMESLDVGHYRIVGNIVHTYLGLFLVLFGLMLLVLFITSIKKDYFANDMELFLLAVYSILGGVWMWSHYGIMEMFWDNVYAIQCMNIISEVMLPLIVLLFLRIKIYNKKHTFWFRCLEVSCIMFVMSVVLLLTVRRFYPYYTLLVLWLYFCIIISIFELHLIRSYFRNRNKLNGFILASVISYYISIAMCFVSFLDKNFTFEFFHKIFCNTIVFVIVQMFFTYMIPMMNYLQGRTERSVLIELAYTDGLTGLLNRNRCEEIVNQIRYDEENFYYVIEFEIINLKTINRSYGYEAGDEALVQFAQCLKQAFEGAMLVSRYSGDEFIVILENVEHKNMIRNMEQLLKSVDLYNLEKEENAKIQYVYGVGECNCMIKGHDIYKMLKVAEKQKYEKAKQLIL